MEDEVHEFVNGLTQSYKQIIEEILANCDSVIEKKLIMFLLDKLVYSMWTSPGSLTFVWELRMLAANPEKFNWPHDNIKTPYRFSGFCLDSFSYVSPDGNFTYYDTLELMPQWYVYYEKGDIKEEGKYYKLDIAIRVTRVYSHKEREVLKLICIECDGHDFHSSPEQKEKDNIRTRKLIGLDWIVLRYSGREIYKINKATGNALWAEIESIIPEAMNSFKS